MKIYCFQLILFIVVWGLTGCGEVEFLTTSPKMDAEVESLFVKSPQMIVYKANKKDKSIEAQEGRFYEQTQKLILTEIKAKFYEQGRWVSEISADSATLFLQDTPKEGRARNDIILEGNVYYKNVEGAYLKTTALIWDNKREMISSGEKYELQRPVENGTLILTGKKFEADKTLKNWKDYGATIRLIPKKI